MKTQILFIFVVACFSIPELIWAQEKAVKDEPIEFGKWVSIYSELLEEERTLMVYVPEGPKESKYPVVYLLDGDGHYYSVAGMIRQLSTTNGNTVLPKMIVVAMPNTKRTRDLTPRKGDPSHPDTDSAMVATSGGGKKFMAFMEKELIPYVEANYPTLPYRTFIGHSLGGLLVMHAWLYHTQLFNAYIAIDPSMGIGAQTWKIYSYDSNGNILTQYRIDEGPQKTRDTTGAHLYNYANGQLAYVVEPSGIVPGVSNITMYKWENGELYHKEKRKTIMVSTGPPTYERREKNITFEWEYEYENGKLIEEKVFRDGELENGPSLITARKD